MFLAEVLGKMLVDSTRVAGRVVSTVADKDVVAIQVKHLDWPNREQGVVARRLTFDMNGDWRPQAGRRPLDGSLERRAPPHTDLEPGTCLPVGILASVITFGCIAQPPQTLSPITQLSMKSTT